MKATGQSRKPFIVDVPAMLLKRNTKLSKGARMLHGTMRGLANGRTGELAIRGNSLDWRFIAREAEIGRDQWQRLLRELLASGLVTRERERVEHYKNGRKRIVLGRARYFVHKQPKRTKKPSILLMPDSPTVEESGTQVFSKTPYYLERGASPVGEAKAVGKKHNQSSSGAPAKPDDDFSVCASESKEANPFLPSEDKNLMDRIRRRLRERWPDLFERYEHHIRDDDFIYSAIEMIDARGKDRIVNDVCYFASSIIDILAVAMTYGESDGDFGWLAENAEKKRALREKFMAGLQPLTAEQEQSRQQFNRMVDGKSQ